MRDRTGAANSNWKGGRRVDSYGYIVIKVGRGHPQANAQGYVREHRLVMHEFLGRILDPREIVHHINGDKTDNRLENLSLTDNGAHASLHHRGKPKSEIHRKRIGEANRRRPPRPGVKHSEETRRRLSEIKKAYWQKRREEARCVL